MRQQYIMSPCSGKAIDVMQNQTITVIDIGGKQVADFFAVTKENPDEFLSTGVTIDCNNSLRLTIGDLIYTNLYRPMFELVADDVGEHDLLHPCCRSEMYDFFYHNGKGHTNCLDTINTVLGQVKPIIHPLNLFMHTKINADGSICVAPPLSKPGDKVVLRALLPMRVGIAACSVSESLCNGGKCSAIEVIIDG